MISKAKLKELASYRMSKVCEMENVFVVEGPKMCLEALQSHMPIVCICALPSWIQNHQSVIEGMEVYEANDAELERISLQKSPNQVWMLLSRSFVPLCQPQAGELTLILDHLQDPGNMGTIIRTADWFGIRHIVCSPDTVSCYNPKVVQSTMGGIFRTTIEYTPLLPYLQQAQRQGREIYGALLDGESIYSTALTSKDALLVIGNESKGISQEVQTLISKRILIPNIGNTCESLNASVACAILLSHFSSSKAKSE